MNLENYHKACLKKISSFFHHKTISNVITISDEDNESLDNVLFLELNDASFIGLFINGSNPYISTHHYDECDDFNLYASYLALNENKSNTFTPFMVEYIEVFFHPEYNELISIFLSSSDFSRSLSISFATDEIHMRINLKKDNLTKEIKDNMLQLQDVDLLKCQIDFNENK